MDELVRKISLKKGLLPAKGATNVEIEEAEKSLGLKFNIEYCEYLKAFGAASFDGYNLTGIIQLTNINVIDVTLRERQNNDNIPLDWYVIEEAGIDGIVIWQNEKGEVFQTMPGQPFFKVCSSISEYIDL